MHVLQGLYDAGCIVHHIPTMFSRHIPWLTIKDQTKSRYYMYSVPARLGKGQGAKEIGHNLACERPKFGHNLVRKQYKIGHSLEREVRHTFTCERPKFGHNETVCAQFCGRAD